jgi:mono/diheme cytochrome c family protein
MRQRRRWQLVAGSLALLAWIGGAAGEPEAVSVVLPAGDAAEGRKAFVELSCTSCHRVAGGDDLPRPVAASPGPTLGPLQALQPPSQIATSIVSPSHQRIEDSRHSRDDELSPMGDYTRSMTVRQLVDLIAYVRSLDGAAKKARD